MPTKIAKLRHKAYIRQSCRCFYCELPTWETAPGKLANELGISKKLVTKLRCTAEHLHPRSEGGKNESSNIVAACLFCNSTRHKFKDPMDPKSYRAHVQRRIKNGRWLHPELRHLLPQTLSQ